LQNRNVLIGYGCADSLRSNGNVIIGHDAASNVTTGTLNVIIGSTAGVSLIDGGSNIIIGDQANIASDASFSIVLGTQVSATAGSQLVIGNIEGITDGYFGNGVTFNTPDHFTLHATGGSGTNNRGANLSLAGGQGTGTGTPGEVIFQTAPTVGSGTTQATLVNAGKFDASTTAGQTRFFLYDVDNGTLERVTVGAADSGGAGFKVLRIPN